MKGSGKILVIIAGFTCMMLFYVHLQVASVLVSLDLHKSSKIFSQKQELFNRLQYKVDQLRAPGLLEKKLKHHELGLTLPNKIQVVEVPMAPAIRMPIEETEKTTHPLSSALLNFFGHWIQTAQAKTDMSS